MEYKILERNGKFMVGKMQKKRKWMFGKAYEEFNCIWKAMYTPHILKHWKKQGDLLK